MTSDRFDVHARELQLDALLHEAAGVLPAPGLADRIADALHGARSRSFIPTGISTSWASSRSPP